MSRIEKMFDMAYMLLLQNVQHKLQLFNAPNIISFLNTESNHVSVCVLCVSPSSSSVEYVGGCVGEQQPPHMLLFLDRKQASTHTLMAVLNQAGPFPGLHGA